METSKKWCKGLWVKQFLTFKYLARVSLSKVSSENTPSSSYISRVIRVYIVLVKNGKSHNPKATGSAFCRSLATWPESRATCENQPFNDSSNSSMCFLCGLFCESAVVSQSRIKSWKPLLPKFFTKLSHTTLTLNPTKIQGNDWMKLQSNLTQN